MSVINNLKDNMPVSRISKITGISRSFIYYNRKPSNTGKSRKSRMSNDIIVKILNISKERVTYGYRRIWAVLRNEGIKINIKTVRRIIIRNNLQLPYAEHKNRTRKRDLTKPENINKLWETDIHYVSTHDGMYYLMGVKDCFSKKWLSYNFSRTCTAKDCIKSVEKAYANRKNSDLNNLILRTDNGTQYTAKAFKETVKLLNIKQEYIKKQTPEDNGDIESFHNSLKTDYIWVNDLNNFNDAKELMEYAYSDYNSFRPHSSIDYLTPDKFEEQWNNSEEFRNKFIENRRKKEERRLKNKENKRKRLNENVSI